MSSPILPAVLGGVVAGGVSAAAVCFVLQAGPAPTPADSVASLDEAALGSLSDQIGAMREEQDELASRVLDLEMRPAAARVEEVAERLDDGPTSGELEAVLAKLGEAGSSGLAVTDFELRNLVSGTLQDIRDQEDAERRQRELERDIERVEERLVRMQDDLGLEPYQVDGMRNVLIDEATKRNELFAELREEGGGRGDMRDAMIELRAETNAAAQLVLTPDQFEKYEESNDWGRGRGGFGGGGGGGRGGGRGGM